MVCSAFICFRRLGLRGAGTMVFRDEAAAEAARAALREAALIGSLASKWGRCHPTGQLASIFIAASFRALS